MLRVTRDISGLQLERRPSRVRIRMFWPVSRMFLAAAHLRLLRLGFLNYDALNFKTLEIGQGFLSRCPSLVKMILTSTLSPCPFECFKKFRAS